MTDADRKLREQCLGSIFWTAWYLCGYRKLSMVLHLAMTLWLQRAIASGLRRLLVMIPRDYFKTSALGIAHVVNFLLNNPEAAVLYVMHNHTTAADKMDEVMAAFESAMMARLFPEYAVTEANKAGLKWTSGRFTIPRESGPRGRPSVTVAGITTGTTGHHFDLIIWDDIIKGDSDEAASQLEAAKRKIRTVIYLLKDKKKNVILVMGTLWEGGFYEKLMDALHWHKLILGAEVDDRFMRFINEVGVKIPGPDDPYVQEQVLESNRDCAWAEGHSIFPEMDDDEVLAEALLESESDYQTQMLNIPSGADSKRFQREDILTYDLRFKGAGSPAYAEVDGVAFPYSGMYRSITWDPTGGESKDCDTAAVTVTAWERANQKAFLLDYFWEKADIITQINWVLDAAVRWKVHVISPEKVAFQVTLKRFLEEEMKRRIADGRMERMIHIDPYPRGSKSKGTWILDSLTPFVSKNMFHVLPEHGAVVDHLVGLNIYNGRVLGDSPGLADALAMQARFWSGKIKRPKRGDDGIVDEDDERAVANMPVKYGLEPSRWSVGLAV